MFDGVGSDSLLLAVALAVDLFGLGGGDFRRGDVGHEGAFVFNCLSEERAPSTKPSRPEGCSMGLWADSARWTAAAEGIVLVTALRVGLNS